MKWELKNLVKSLSFAAFSLFLIGQANAQCETWENYPEGVKAARQKHVIYHDLVKLEKYDKAYPLWEELFKYVKIPAPAKATHYMDGIEMSLYFAEQETDAAKKKAWIDKAIDLYNQNAACNGETAIDRAYQAYYMYVNQYDVKETLDTYEKVLELGEKEGAVPAMILTPMAYLAVYCYQKKVKGYDADYMRSLYTKLEKAAQEQIKKGNDVESYKNGWAEVDKYYGHIKGQIFGCDYYIAKEWTADFNTNKASEEKVKAIRDAMALKGCKETDLYKEVQQTYEKIVEDRVIAEGEARLADPNVSSWEKIQICRMFHRSRKDDSWKTKEKEYYKRAIEEEGSGATSEERADLAYRYADQLFRAGNFSGARSYCRTASKLRPNWGEPYLLVGIMYASSGPRCSKNGTGWNAQICVWPAIDEWVKAKSVDPSAAAKANKYIAKYSAFMPTEADIFKRQLSVGTSITVPCWIQQTTTIRAK